MQTTSLADPHTTAAPDRLARRLRGLQGLDPHGIGLIAYRLCLERDDPASLRTLGDVLIHLRRFGLETFDPSAHQAHRRLCAEQEAARPHPPYPTGLGLFRVGESVVVTGEPHRAFVVHRVFATGHEDLHPAPWYVTVAHRPALCRAHGADELEPPPDDLRPARRPPGPREPVCPA